MYVTPTDGYTSGGYRPLRGRVCGRDTVVVVVEGCDDSSSGFRKEGVNCALTDGVNCAS